MALKKDTQMDLIYINEKFHYNEQFKSSYPEVLTTITNTITLNDVYYMINYLEGNKNEIKFTLVGYENENKDVIVETERHSFVPDVSSNSTPNFYVQAYTYLKTLEKFSDASDC